MHLWGSPAQKVVMEIDENRECINERMEEKETGGSSGTGLALREKNTAGSCYSMSDP